jgi:hypothetical protein
MPKRTSYSQGTPNWVDLQTSDQDAAKSFYGTLFGWTFDDQAMPQGPPYSMALKGGDFVGAIAPLPQELAARGVPPFWNTYIAVDDVDAATAAVKGAGGQVAMEPFDVMDAGRMSAVTDPGGATACLWQAKEHIGARLVNEPGALIWNELITDEPDASFAFYHEVLGLDSELSDMGGNPYTLLKVGDDMVAGSMPPPMEGVANHWHVYFAVEDLDASLEQARGLGAGVIAGPISTPIGSMATLSDPQGALFSLFQPTGHSD